MREVLHPKRGRLYLLLCVAVLVVLLLLGLQIWYSYQETIHEAEITTSNYAAMLEVRLDATLRRADTVLQGLARSIPVAALNQQAMARHIREVDAKLDSGLVNFEELAGLRVFGVDGALLYTSDRAGTKPANIADRSHFRALRDNPRAGLVFSEVIISRITGRKTLIAARALPDGRGAFGGIVVASIELDNFQRLFQSLETGPHGLIAIRRSDNFGLVVHWPPRDSELNQGLPPSNPLRAAISAGTKKGTIEFRANIDGIMRIFAFHELKRYPFYVAAGLARDDVLAGWRKRALLIAGASLGLLCLVAGLLASLWRMAAREARIIAQLARSERRLREAQVMAGLGTYAFDLATGAWESSDILDGIFGIDGKFTRSRAGWRSLVHPDDRAMLANYFTNEIVGKQQPFDKEFKIVRHDDGAVRWLYGQGRLVHDARGNPARLIGTIQDFTERKQTEEKIRQSEEFIRSILDTVDEGFIVLDRDYRILTANKAYCEQTSRPGEEVIGRRCFEISHKIGGPCFDEGEECAVRQVFETGKPHSAIHKHPGTNGHILFVETKAFPIKDGSGNTTSVIETLNNITERHLLEEERLKTQKLESIGTLAGGIAHDFNNLLQGIFGYISLAKICIDQKDRSLEMIEQAEKALHQSVSLTTQLLTFARGGKPVREVISLEPVIENAVRFALSGSPADSRLAIDPGLWRVDADAGQLGQVIQNIAINANQAMPLGGHVEITARNVPASDPDLPQGLARRRHVMISIRDNGVGIPEQDLGRIFDPYFTTKEKGSGLGLATSYSIIRNHEGLILAKSEVGKGSIFALYLPATADVVEAPREAPVVLRTRNVRILVMDDEEVIRKVAGGLLTVLGHSVAFSDRGEAAIDAFREARDASNPFDIVILDLTIRGGMGGVETVGRLREIDPDVKAVASSGYSDDATLADHRAQGFTAFLKKPYSINELRDTLSAILV